MPPEASLSDLGSPSASSDSRSDQESSIGTEDEISVLDILTISAQRKRTILRTTVCFATVALIVSLILPTRYTASVSLLPPQQNSSMSSSLLAQMGNLGGVAALAGGTLGIKNPNDMYVAMLKSRTVEDGMITQFGLMQEYSKRYLSDTRKVFEKRASVDGSGKDGLIRISVEDRDPNRAAELANGYIAQFRQLSEHLAITEASQRRVFFERQLEEAKNNLATSEESLKATQQTTGLIQLDSQARALIESAAALRAQIAAKEVQIQSLQTFATSENSQLVRAEQELASLRAQLTRLGGSETGGDDELMVPKGKVPEAGLQYVRKLRDVKYYETIFGIIARQFEMAKLDEAKQGALIQVVDAAVPPDKRSFPKRALIVLGATAFGFFAGCFLAFFQHGFEQMKRDPVRHRKWMRFRDSLPFNRAR